MRLTTCATLVTILLCGLSTAAAQGITVKKSAVILYGSAANCTQPASIDWKKVSKATPEWKKIQAEGVQKGTGRYDLLMSALSDRIKKASAKAADSAGHDCVVRNSDLKDAKGLKVEDLTAEVIAELGS